METKRCLVLIWRLAIFSCCVIANLGWLGFNETVETVSKDSLRRQNETFVTPSHLQWVLSLLADRLEVTLGEEWSKYYAQVLGVTSSDPGYESKEGIKVKKNDLTRKIREIGVEVARHRISSIFWKYDVKCNDKPSAYELSKLAREVMEPFNSKYWGVAGFTKVSNDEVVLERPLYCREDSSGVEIAASARYYDYQHKIQVMLRISGEKVNVKAGYMWGRDGNIELISDAIYSKTAQKAYQLRGYQERKESREREQLRKEKEEEERVRRIQQEAQERAAREEQEKAKQEERERLAKAREEAINRRNQSEAKVREQKGYANRFDSFCGIKFGASIGESAKRTWDGKFLYKTMRLPHALRGCLYADVYASVKTCKICLIRMKCVLPNDTYNKNRDVRAYLGVPYSPSMNSDWVKSEIDVYNEMFRKRYGVELVKQDYNEYVCKLENGEISVSLHVLTDDERYNLREGDKDIGCWLIIEAKHYDFMNNSRKEFESESDIDLL